ncbi:MAG: ferredoxin, partial [Pseudomonadota bacterium]
MEHAAIARAAGAEGLRIEAAFAPGPETPGIAPGARAIVLLGPDGPRFWPRFVTAPEMADGEAHPLDRWSERVVGALAKALGARAAF